MSELRKDPLHERWVVVAPERDRRPWDPAPGHVPDPCPFCPGHEGFTPPAIVTVQPPGAGAPWQVRVFPHRQPALRVEGDLEPGAVGVMERLGGVGAHEIVVETPRHGVGWADLSPAEVLQVLLVWQDRQRDLYRDARIEHAMVHKHHEPRGARLATAAPDHAHSHLIGTPVTPRAVEDELRSAVAYHARTRRCALCDLVAEDLRDGARVVAADERAVVVAPYASRFPFELRLCTRRHRHALADTSREELASIAALLVDACGRLRLALEDPPFDLALHSAPNPRPLRPHPYPTDTLHLAWHWYLELVPRLLPLQGQACASGLHVNPTPPEVAASFLRGLG
ncbi:MAG: galactose-1-phosphate uridylyltransferase [Pseudomonadota bacterium]